MGHTVENPPPMTTMDTLMDSLRQTGPLPEIRAADAIPPEDPLLIYPITEAHGKSTIKSLMRPIMSPKGCCLTTYSFNFNNSVTMGALPTVVPTGPQKSSKQQLLWAHMSAP
jgi:hypothetical protein